MATTRRPSAPPDTTLVLLVRHGQTNSTGTLLPGRAPGLHLSDAGRTQAETVATRLADLGPAVLYPPPWLGYANAVVNAVLIFGSLLFSLLPAQRCALERDPSAAFTGEQRRQVWRKLRGREAVADSEIPLLRAAARRRPARIPP